MARTKQTARKKTGLLKAVKEDSNRKDDPVLSTSGGGGKPHPKIKTGRIDRRKQLIPVRKLSMEDQIRKAQKRTDLSFSKAYFAR